MYVVHSHSTIEAVHTMCTARQCEFRSALQKERKRKMLEAGATLRTYYVAPAIFCTDKAFLLLPCKFKVPTSISSRSQLQVSSVLLKFKLLHCSLLESPSKRNPSSKLQVQTLNFSRNHTQLHRIRVSPTFCGSAIAFSTLRIRLQFNVHTYIVPKKFRRTWNLGGDDFQKKKYVH